MIKNDIRFFDEVSALYTESQMSSWRPYPNKYSKMASCYEDAALCGRVHITHNKYSVALRKKLVIQGVLRVHACATMKYPLYWMETAELRLSNGIGSLRGQELGELMDSAYQSRQTDEWSLWVLSQEWASWPGECSILSAYFEVQLLHSQ